MSADTDQKGTAPKFILDGVTYELPDGDDLTMKELMLPHRYASHLEITGDPPPACYMLAALHAAIARARPKTTADEIEERLLGLKQPEMQELRRTWEAAGDADPTPSESAEQTPSPVSSSSSDSEPGPEPELQNGIGDQTSDISSGSVPAISAT